MKNYQFLLVAINLISLLLVGCGEDGSTGNGNEVPVIISIMPDSGKIGEEVTLTGTAFGSAKGTSRVSFTGADATEYTNWSDTEIKVKVPASARTGKVSVTVNGEPSNEVDFTLNTSSIGCDNTEVQICNQIWAGCNLDVEFYRNGDPIPEVTDPLEWSNLTTGAWCYYDNDPTNGEVYGKLYNWHAVNDPRGLAPEGWHVPTDKEWKELEMCLGMSQSEADDQGDRGTDEGSKLAGRADLWVDGSLDANANFGASDFSAPPGGYRGGFGPFFGIGYYGLLWSSSEYSSTSGWTRSLLYDFANVGRGRSGSKEEGFLVRCVRD